RLQVLSYPSSILVGMDVPRGMAGAVVDDRSRAVPAEMSASGRVDLGQGASGAQRPERRGKATHPEDRGPGERRRAPESWDLPPGRELAVWLESVDQCAVEADEVECVLRARARQI